MPFRPFMLSLAAALVLTGQTAHAAFGAFGGAAQTDPRQGRWAHEDSSLAPDERVIWGRLDNGFRYALLPHRGVPRRVSMRLIVLSGSLDEKDNELGIAHFTEHMAFRGTKSFKAENMTSFFQRLGMEYGSEVNAFTTHDFTTYSLEFHENAPALLDEGFRLFREIGDSIAFEPAAIDKERRVILAELRTRDSLTGRLHQASFPVIFRGSQFPNRNPGGSLDLIRSFKREDFLRFYRRCYRPDLMVLVLAGDVDPAVYGKVIRDTFGDMTRPAEPIPPREEGRLDARNLRAGIFRIGGVGSAETTVASVTPPSRRADSRDAQIEQQRRRFVSELLSERLRTLIPNAGGGGASDETLMQHNCALASVTVPGPEWAHGVLSLDHIIRHTHRNGFEKDEVEELRRRWLRLADHMLKQIPALDPAMLCDTLTDSITGRTVFTGLDHSYEWMKDWLEKFTPSAALRTFRGMWDPDALAFHVSGDVGIELDSAEVLKRVQKQRRAKLAYLPPRQQFKTVFKLPQWGKTGSVAERKEIPELGAHLVRFENNVRLNFVSSAQEPGLVRGVVRIGTGLLDMPGNKPALKEFGLNTLLGSGSVHFRPDDIGNAAGEHLLEFGFDVGDQDAFTFRGLAGVENLDVFLALATDFLHEPQFYAGVHDSARALAAVGRMSSSVGFEEGMRELTNHLFKGQPRFMYGTPMDYISLGVLDVRRWMEESLVRGYVEITLVGDLSASEAEHAVARTLGSLAPRDAAKRLTETDVPPTVSAPAAFKRIEFVGEHNLGMAVVTWPVDGVTSLRQQVALEVLTKILERRTRWEVRDSRGLAYAPSADFNPFVGFRGFALLQTNAACAPDDTAQVAAITAEQADRLAREGASEEEFTGAQSVLATKFRRAFHDNGFLVWLLMRAQERPETVKEAVALHDDLIDRVTIEEVNDWAAKVLPSSNCRSAVLVPKAFIGIFDSQKP